jgi:hypothetical protein
VTTLYAEVIEPALGPIGVVVGGVLTFLGVRFTARTSAKAAAAATGVSNRQVDVEEWKSLVEALRVEVTRLTTRVDKLEAERETDGTVRRALLAYVLELLAWARLIAPSAVPPPPPAVIADEIP